MSITEKTLEQVFERRFTDAGENWRGSCPFHTDRTPSFYVHKLEFICNCFGCGRAGMVDRLAAEYAGITLQQAQSELDLKLEDRINAARRKTKETKPSRYFPNSWLSPWGRKAHRYILDRGFTGRTLKQAEALYDHSLKRQVFPIRDRDRRLIGAVGRTTREEQPKWYFYWKCDKGQCLYIPPGSASRNGTREDVSSSGDRGEHSKFNGRNNSLIIVEGVLDVLWLHQHGYENSAAFIGTKFTQQQVNEIKDMTDEVIICLDNDDSGRDASERLYKALHKSCRVRFARWPADMQNKGDICDLDRGEINDLVCGAESRLQRAIRIKANSRTSRTKNYATGKEPEVR